MARHKVAVNRFNMLTAPGDVKHWSSATSGGMEIKAVCSQLLQTAFSLYALMGAVMVELRQS